MWRAAGLWWVMVGAAMLVVVAAVVLARPSDGGPAAREVGDTASPTSPSPTSPSTSRPSPTSPSPTVDSSTGAWSTGGGGRGPGPVRQPRLAVERRGCGWFVAYELTVIESLDAELGRSALSRAQRDVLHGAVSGDTDELRSGLLAGGVADIVLPGFEYTPLTAAIASRCGQAVRLLLASGARPALAPPGSEPPLLVAVLVGDVEAVTALMSAGADPDAAGPGGSARSVAGVLGDPLVLAALDGVQSTVPDPGGATGDA